MIALDTSIVVRLLARDDEGQLAVARAFVLENHCFITWTVLAEVGWVLDAIYGLSRETLVSGIVSLLDMETIFVVNDAALRWAMDRYLDGADWADMIHVAACDVTVETFATFDRRLAKQAGAESPLAVRTLRA